MNLHGKSREQIAAALERHTRAELVALIAKLATVEQHFKPSEIAERVGMDKRTVLQDIHAGRFGGSFFKRSENQIRIAASAVNDWLASCRVQVR